MAKKNVNYKAILKDGLILMIAGLVFAFIVKLGFDQLRGDVEESPLVSPIIQDNIDKMKEIIGKDAKTVNQQDEQKRTPLMWVAYLNYGDRELITKKSTSKKEDGTEVEKPSLEEKRLEMTKLLLENGADVKAVDEDNWTALLWASWTGMPTVVEALVKAGSDVNALDTKKQSPLMVAAQRGNEKVVEILINAGADATLKNVDGKSAEDLANEYMAQFSSRKENYEATLKALKTPAKKETHVEEKAVETSPETSPEAPTEEAAPAEEVKEEPKAE
ncbi:ankyrin repeat domain-containing protein [bacterium]|nr:ankyrin repeat domain-containing protein [bacterium]